MKGDCPGFYCGIILGVMSLEWLPAVKKLSTHVKRYVADVDAGSKVYLRA